MDKKLAELKLASMILLTRPHNTCEPYAILKIMEDRCNQIVEACFNAGYNIASGETILKTINDE
jgi:hypothetical protein